MTPFNASQLKIFLTESEKLSQLESIKPNHLVILRFPQFEEIFTLTVRNQERRIAMMPTISFDLTGLPSLYMTYSDFDLRAEGADPIDSPILGLSIPINSSNLNFKMEDIFEHQYGTFLLESDKEKNAKVIEDIRSYLENMVELLAVPLEDDENRLNTLDRMVADYVPFVRVVSDVANCKLKGYESSKVNVNLVWDGSKWMAQLQNAYHPLWNLMLCRADFATYTAASLEKKNFLISLEKAAKVEYWSKALNIIMDENCAKFISMFDVFVEKHQKVA